MQHQAGPSEVITTAAVLTNALNKCKVDIVFQSQRKHHEENWSVKDILDEYEEELQKGNLLKGDSEDEDC